MLRFPPDETFVLRFFCALPAPAPDTPDCVGDPKVPTGPPRLARAAQQGAPDTLSRSCTYFETSCASPELRNPTPDPGGQKMSQECHKGTWGPLRVDLKLPGCLP